VNGVAIGAQYAAFSDFRQNGGEAIAIMHHIGKVYQTALAGPVLIGRINVIELQCHAVGIESTMGATHIQFDGVNNGAGIRH
jgi:hypothetical protein